MMQRYDPAELKDDANLRPCPTQRMAGMRSTVRAYIILETLPLGRCVWAYKSRFTFHYAINSTFSLLWGLFMSVTRLDAWKALKAHSKAASSAHLVDLLQDAKRSKAMMAEHSGVVLDYSRQNATAETTKLLVSLAEEAGLKKSIKAMVSGKHINVTEDRAVLHTALRAF